MHHCIITFVIHRCPPSTLLLSLWQQRHVSLEDEYGWTLQRKDCGGRAHSWGNKCLFWLTFSPAQPPPSLFTTRNSSSSILSSQMVSLPSFLIIPATALAQVFCLFTLPSSACWLSCPHGHKMAAAVPGLLCIHKFRRKRLSLPVTLP